MFPSGSHHQLISYELYLDPAALFPSRPSLRSTSGGYDFQEIAVSQQLCGHQLSVLPLCTDSPEIILTNTRLMNTSQALVWESFMYGLGRKLGFEFRNRHLESLMNTHG
ncbi:hypothetical protein A0H81_00938 [Grifola frondosa]|uniref:Uncharacterized protein n=1 Tax=Grifola frondosa TaxID=5627 RepID=A0A1C7MT48_GRIFR|nr:hypothetical protein A0H81_00938 [Grifola frondosa]